MKNFKRPTVRVIFDRRSKATKSTSRKPQMGTVEICIYHERERRIASTGIRAYSDQWTDAAMLHGRSDADISNARIRQLVKDAEDVIGRVMERHGTFSFELYDEEAARGTIEDRDFIAFMRERIEERTDIGESTRRKHRSILATLEQFGRIRLFADLTYANIYEYDQWLHSREWAEKDGTVRRMSQVTIHTQHKTVKTYVNLAVNLGIIHQSPYSRFKAEKGVGRGNRYLTDEELARVMNCKLDSRLERVRDVFLFQCFTSLSYADMAKLDFGRDAFIDNGKYKIVDTRVKTDQEYYVVLGSNAMEILRKYDYSLPVISNQKMNEALKLIAVAADVRKPISTHYARHTYCVLSLNCGEDIDLVSRAMGHSSTSVTRAAYARLMTKTMDTAADRIDAMFGRIKNG